MVAIGTRWSGVVPVVVRRESLSRTTVLPGRDPTTQRLPVRELRRKTVTEQRTVELRRWHRTWTVAAVAPWRVEWVDTVLTADVGAQRTRCAPTLAASNVDCSNGSYSHDRSLLFFHFDNELIWCSYASRWILLLCNRPFEAGNLLSVFDPNLKERYIGNILSLRVHKCTMCEISSTKFDLKIGLVALEKWYIQSSFHIIIMIILYIESL